MTKSKKIIYAIATNIILFVALEGLSRLLIQKPPETKFRPVEFVANDFKNPIPGFQDEEILWRIPPGTPVTEGRGEVANNLGFRGPDVSAEKPKDTIRIVCIGGTSTYGRGLGISYTFSRRLQSWLGKYMRPKWEVINLGLPNATSFQALRIYQTIASKLDPDYVIVYIGTWHDFTPAIEFDDENALEQIRLSRSVRRGITARRLRFYQWFTWILNKPAPSRVGEYLNNWSVYTQRADGPRVSASKFKKYLIEIANETHAAGVKTLFVTPPVKDNARIRFTDSEIYTGIINNVAADHGIPVVNARALLDNSKMDESDLFNNDLQPSGIGHSMIAEAIAATLQETGAVPSIHVSAAEYFRVETQSLFTMRDKAEYYVGNPPAQASAAEAIKWDPEAISLPSPGIFAFRNVRIAERTSLQFDPSYYTRKDFTKEGAATRPVRTETSVHFIFEIRVGDDNAPGGILYDESLSGDDAGIWRIAGKRTVDLSPFAGKTVTLVFRTEGNSFRASWGKPLLFTFAN